MGSRFSGAPATSPGFQEGEEDRGDFHRFFAYDGQVFDPDANLPRPNRSLIYFGACIIAGLRLARQSQVSPRVLPTMKAIDESCDLAHDIFYRVFRVVPGKLK